MGIKKFKIYTLFVMVVLAVIFAIAIFVSWPPRNTFTLLSLFISALLLIIDLIAIISFVFVTVIFKVDNARQVVKFTSISVVCLLVIIPVVIVLINPLRWPSVLQRDRMLRLTPIGTSMEEVVKVIESQEKWKIRNISYEHGYINYDYKVPEWPTSSVSGLSIIGAKSIMADVGEYSNPFVTSVTVSWGFNEEATLIDVYVRKSMDVW